jgi:hypothetical protein
MDFSFFMSFSNFEKQVDALMVASNLRRRRIVVAVGSVAFVGGHDPLAWAML